MRIERTEIIYSIDIEDEDCAKMFADFLEHWKHWELCEIIGEWLDSVWGTKMWFTRGDIDDVFEDMMDDVHAYFEQWAAKNDVELIEEVDVSPMTAKNVKWLKEYKK